MAGAIFTIEVPKKPEGEFIVNKDTSLQWVRGNQLVKLLEKEIIGPFLDSFKRKAAAEFEQKTAFKEKYTSSNPCIHELSLGGIILKTEVYHDPVKPAIKEGVFEPLVQYLKNMIYEYERGAKPQGVLTIDNNPYISITNLYNKIKHLSDDVKDIQIKQSQEPETKTSKDLEAEIQQILDGETPAVPFEAKDYSELTAENAKAYVLAKTAAEIIKKNTVTPFDQKIKEIVNLYKTKEDLKETKEYLLLVGPNYLKIQVVPQPSTKWAEIINSLVNVAESGLKDGERERTLEEIAEFYRTNPAQLEKAKTTGMLIKIAAGQQIEGMTARYREGTWYVLITDVQEILEKLIKEHTKTKNQVSKSFYPLI